MPSTREEIYSYLEKITRNFPRNFNIKDFRRHTANDISEALNISRNLASQYLNELVKEKRVIKVNSRPVYFFHKKMWNAAPRQFLMSACFPPGRNSS